MLHDCIELAGRGLHPSVRIPHAPAGVGAGTACGLTQLVDYLFLKPRDVSPLEFPVDPVIARDADYP